MHNAGISVLFYLLKISWTVLYFSVIKARSLFEDVFISASEIDRLRSRLHENCSRTRRASTGDCRVRTV